MRRAISARADIIAPICQTNDTPSDRQRILRINTRRIAMSRDNSSVALDRSSTTPSSVSACAAVSRIAVPAQLGVGCREDSAVWLRVRPPECGIAAIWHIFSADSHKGSRHLNPRARPAERLHTLHHLQRGRCSLQCPDVIRVAGRRQRSASLSGERYTEVILPTVARPRRQFCRLRPTITQSKTANDAVPSREMIAAPGTTSLTARSPRFTGGEPGSSIAGRHDALERMNHDRGFHYRACRRKSPGDPAACRPKKFASIIGAGINLA